MAFDMEGARREGYSDAEILEHLAKQRGFDAAGARREGYSDAEILGHLAAPPQRGIGERAARAAGQVGAGFNERLSQTLGALPDLYNRGLRAVGLPAMAEGAYTRGIQGGINAVVGEPATPEGALERGARGVGHGIADVGTVLAPATALAQTARAGTVLHGASQALAAQPLTQLAAGATGGAVGGATENPLLGAAAGLAVPLAAAGATRAITPLQTAIDPQRARLAAIADQEGIPLTLGQRTGNRTLQNVEGAFETLPGTAGRQGEVLQQGRDGFNAAVLRQAGINADRATPDVLAAARTQAGNEIGTIAARHTPDFAGAPVQALQALRHHAEQYAGADTGRIVANRVQQILDRLQQHGGTTMPGQTWREMDTELRRAAEGAPGDLVRYLGQIRDTMMAALVQVAGPAEATALREARARYGAVMDIAESMAGPGAATAAGNISPAALRSALASGNRVGHATGQTGELGDLARVGETFVRPAIPNSGTPERTRMANLLTGGPMLGGTAGASLMGADPATALAVGAGAMALPRVAQSAYNSDWFRRYMLNQLLQGAGPTLNPELGAALLAGPGRQAVLPPPQ